MIAAVALSWLALAFVSGYIIGSILRERAAELPEVEIVERPE